MTIADHADLKTPDQRAIAELARDFAEGEIAPHIAQWDRERTFPREVFRKLADVGLMGMLVPEEYGGAAIGYVAYALVIEEISRVDAGTGVTLSVHSMVSSAIARLGTPAQCDRFLPRLTTGDIAAFALTEPDAGSDAARIASRATRTPNGWRLDGRKQWCTNGSQAAVTLAMFRTGDDGSKGISAFLVPSDTKGYIIDRLTEKLGIHTSDTCDLVFDAAEVAADALLLAEGQGYSTALGALGGGRIGVAAQACGILAASLASATAFAKQRQAFGRAIGSFEGISFKLARMATNLHAARLMTHHAGALADAGLPFATEASMAKVFASQSAREGASDAVQILGGYGYTTEFPVERHYRDAKITEIYEGTTEIQLMLIARSLLGRLDFI